MNEDLPPHLHFASRRHNPKSPSHLGTRHDAEGRFLIERGNTIVCHLVEGSESERVIRAVRERYKGMPGADRLAFTAESSLHMTLFQGIIESRRALPFWPEDVSVHAPVDDMTAIFMDRLAGFAPGEAFAMELTHATPVGLVLDGVTASDRERLRRWRDRLGDLFGYRHPDHETYKFHITFAYLIERLDDATMATWVPVLEQLAAEIRAAAPVIELRAPAFCAFDDMNHFEELLVLDAV
ncbi:DUF1868 domain-containing protein [Rhizobium sp. AAP43]|uniref:DUF1868 domain-containing protein n=1 Tax=Rhizobium sp. AAP43 TaxID=1523420 RepID=UPI0006B8AE93|nr:DUF1868 domain-containing protein [Rhizobium sp. AAP43]KPF45447.1 hypothetical protein IP76_07785 [Rhizobium sp. AAP43]